ncbi:MAG: patatin-like phospholipase family protein, partial [Leptospiraceae bacterium]|nr:patatin-like phospholipase family protein [Leptospiraceae bacterium]
MRHSLLLAVARKSPLFRGIEENQLSRILKHFHQQHVRKGELLFKANQKSRVMYFVVEGKLRVERVAGPREVVRIASLTPGDVVGEVALLTGERHSGQVRALTDAWLAGIRKAELETILHKYPRLLLNLTKIEAWRLRSNIVRGQKNPNELGFILHLYCTSAQDYLLVYSHLSNAVVEQRIPGMVFLKPEFLRGASGSAELRQRVSKILTRNTSAYLAIHFADLGFTTACALLQMADRLVLTVSEDATTIGWLDRLLSVPDVRKRLPVMNPVLSLLHRAQPDHLTIPEIEEKLGLKVHYRIRLGKKDEKPQERILKLQCTTLARILCDNTQGIAFGGGGARALSEIGILSELERQQIEFDHVAGTSMGALIATFYAMGLSAREISELFRKHLPSDKGILRYNLPFIAFFRDRSMNRILRRLFGKMRIEDLPRPLTIIAADLISGKEIRIRKGLISRALRASMSLPVIFAPVRYHNHYLVDGGAINNVPGNALRELGVRRVLGINCTPLTDDSVSRYLTETNLFQLLKPGGDF